MKIDNRGRVSIPSFSGLPPGEPNTNVLESEDQCCIFLPPIQRVTAVSVSCLTLQNWQTGQVLNNDG